MQWSKSKKKKKIAENAKDGFLPHLASFLLKVTGHGFERLGREDYRLCGEFSSDFRPDPTHTKSVSILSPLR